MSQCIGRTSLLIKKCWSAQCLIILVTFAAHTPAWHSFSLKLRSCICRPVFSWSVHFWCDTSLPHDSSIVQRNTKASSQNSPATRTTQNLSLLFFHCGSCWFPSRLSRPNPNPSSSKKPFSIFSPSDLIPIPYTPQALCTFIILALTYLSLSYIKVILCVCLSYGIWASRVQK